MAPRPANDGRPAWLGAAEALYAAALRLYPRAFRERWGEPMRQAFRDRCREVARGERSGFALLHESIADLASGAGREHANAAGNAAPARLWLALACLLLLAVTLAAREQIAWMAQRAGEAATERWTQLQDALEARALRHYWDDVADGLEGGAAPTARTTRAFALLGANTPERARGLLHEAMAADDSRAFWLVATECQRDKACDIGIDAALDRWQRIEPDNAAPALFAFEHAMSGGRVADADRALARAARAAGYRAHDFELLQSLFPAVEATRVPSRLRAAADLQDQAMAADFIAITAWGKHGLPRFDALLDRCRPGADAGSGADCIAVARQLADSTLLLGRIVGSRVLCRYLCASAERPEAEARIAEYRWILEHIDYRDVAWTASWFRAWHAEGMRGEFDVYRRLVSDRGTPAAPPPGYRVPARSLDPAR